MQGVVWHMWAPILNLKRHSIPVTKPNNTAMFNLVRGVLKWAFLKTCVVNGTHATKTYTVLNALKKAIVAFTDDVAWARQQPPTEERPMEWHERIRGTSRMFLKK